MNATDGLLASEFARQVMSRTVSCVIDTTFYLWFWIFFLISFFNCIHYKVFQGFVKYKVGKNTAFRFSAIERSYILV